MKDHFLFENAFVVSVPSRILNKDNCWLPRDPANASASRRVLIPGGHIRPMVSLRGCSTRLYDVLTTLVVSVRMVWFHSSGVGVYTRCDGVSVGVTAQTASMHCDSKWSLCCYETNSPSKLRRRYVCTYRSDIFISSIFHTAII